MPRSPPIQEPSHAEILCYLRLDILGPDCLGRPYRLPGEQSQGRPRSCRGGKVAPAFKRVGWVESSEPTVPFCGGFRRLHPPYLASVALTVLAPAATPRASGGS